MKMKHFAMLGMVLLLWNCNLPLETWYEEMTGDNSPPESTDPLPVNNPVDDPPGDPGGDTGDDPGGEPGDNPPPAIKDEIDFRKIHWNDYDIGDWPIEGAPFGVDVDARYIRWTYDQSGWPSRDNVNGNIFFIWEENGRYYGESFEHIRPRAKLISAAEVKGGGKLRSKPDGWKPVRGRKYGMVLTSHIRGWSEVKRRTNIEIITWERD